MHAAVGVGEEKRKVWRGMPFCVNQLGSNEWIENLMQVFIIFLIDKFLRIVSFRI